MKDSWQNKWRAVGALMAALMLCSCAAFNKRAAPMLATVSCPSVATVLATLRPARETGGLVVVPGRDACVGDKLRYAAQQLMPGGRSDLPKAQAFVNDVLAQSAGREQDEWRGLALLLNQQLVERRRADADQDRLSQQLKAEQKRANDAQARLEALKQVEQTMMQRTIDKKGGQP
ncbi:hypothetical protein QU481_05325 [Crenobacter sp. SG2303]|uniref:Lipoprotein n=1 Tax=Crenobacter oryzisoli TaxID=3056844 RepID=A0ABT7XKI9_9NEIS|nr:hypothetical protein [Crenobacter sp. SG2303]MDN0074312.1 hypothetical protein [Crenobacter sp. SG2303]